MTSLEIAKRDLLNCIECQKQFKRLIPYQLHCSQYCHDKQEKQLLEIESNIYNYKCCDCGIGIRRPGYRKGKSRCIGCNKQHHKKYYKKIENTPKPKKKSLSLQEQIRRMEWKRVMDDAGWDHYLLGKKYDKI